MGFIFFQYQFTRPMVRFIILIAFYLAFSATYQVAYCTLSANELFVQLMEMERTYLQLRLDRIEAYFNSHELGGSTIPSDQSPPLGESSLSERTSLVSPPAQVEPPSPTGSTGSTGENDSGRFFEQSLDNLNANLLRQMDEERASLEQSISNTEVRSADSTVVTGPSAHVTIYGRRDQDGEFSAEMFQSRADMKTSSSDGNFLQRMVRGLFTVTTQSPPEVNVTVDMKMKMEDGSYKSVVNPDMRFSVDENDSVDTRSNPSSPRTCDSPSEVTLRTGLRESPPKDDSETIEDALKRCYQK